MSLISFLKDQIAKNGPMTGEMFHFWCLYHPQEGYYMTQQAVGGGGDFVTAPEVSQMFGEITGVWLLDFWHQMGCPGAVQVVECGPGSGIFMADIVRVVRSLDPSFLEAAHLDLVEVNPLLQAMQKKAIQHHAVDWFDNIEGALRARKGPCFILCNEFLDTFPVQQIKKSVQGWEERCVNWCKRKGSFEWVWRPFQTAALPQGGDFIEQSPQQEAFCQNVMETVARRGGIFWVCDYGSSFEEGGESLQALFKKTPCCVLQNPGKSDLSSHVRFKRLISLARICKLSSVGPVPQSAFLKALGIERRLQCLRSGKSLTQRADLQAQYERLISPMQMGSLFKVFAAYAPENLTPAGFAGH